MKKLLFLIILLTILGSQISWGQTTVIPEGRLPDIFRRSYTYHGTVNFHNIVNIEKPERFKIQGVPFDEYIQGVTVEIQDPLTLNRGLIIDRGNRQKGIPGVLGITETMLGIQGIPVEQGGWIPTPEDNFKIGSICPSTTERPVSVDFVPTFQNTIKGENYGVKIKRIDVLLFVYDDISSVTIEGVYNELDLDGAW